MARARPKDFSVVLRQALHLSRSAPTARCDLPSDKGRSFGRTLRLTVLVMQRSLGQGEVRDNLRATSPLTPLPSGEGEPENAKILREESKRAITYGAYSR